MKEENKKKIKICDFSNTHFENLMQKRIKNILIVASEYDSFTLSVDGRIDERIFEEYKELNLSSPPKIKHVHNSEDALDELDNNIYQLVITMLNVGKFDAFKFASEVKAKFPRKPVILLTPFNRKVSKILEKEDLKNIDYVFSWLGNAEILLPIIKLMEDKRNIDKDIKVGVQVIILVEDSVRYYSGFLIRMYKVLMTQSQKLQREGLNKHQKMMRQRGRPKIVLARNYEDAAKLYKKYKKNVLGIISDTSFKRNKVRDYEAGLRLLKSIKEKNKYTPLLLQSSDKTNELKANDINVGFIYKYSDTFVKELTDFMNKYFAFGAFQFKASKNDNTIIASAENLKALQDIVISDAITDDSYEYHATRNHISKWLNARALFSLARFLQDIKIEDFKSIWELRQYTYNCIKTYRQHISKGIITEYTNEHNDSSNFSRIGKGYMGGKARGLAFLDHLIKNHPELNTYNGVVVRIPKTIVISTDIFDIFMEGELHEFALKDYSNEEILNKFLQKKLPSGVISKLKSFLSFADFPIAVRSSSVLEDSHYQPFAGVFSTYMVPNSSDDDTNLHQLITAIKSVYASVFYKETKAYMKVTKNLIDEEKMGVVLQEISGNRYGDRFYPTFSGVARSVNFYPIEDEKPDEGIVNIALGLGKHIVEGKKTLRFSPEHPKKVLQLSSPNIALRDTQKTFFSLDMRPESFVPSTDESVNYFTESIRQAEKDESIYDISSVYDYDFNILKESKFAKGKRIITFANILKYSGNEHSFPLAKIIKNVLYICKEAMNNPVEIEFAVNLTPTDKNVKYFNLLQIRPIVKEIVDGDIDFSEIKKENTLIYSETALGHGIVEGVKDIIYVKPNNFDSSNNEKIVPIIDMLNDKFIKEDKNYVLSGPGRWGSSDSWLGIPVKWSQISAARLIIESGLKDYRIEPSQGTHFFQNLTSFHVGYLTVNPYRKDGFIDFEYLDKLDAIYEDEYIRHIRFKEDIIIKIDGSESKGVVLKPEKND